jgi:hypothetical protein
MECHHGGRRLQNASLSVLATFTCTLAVLYALRSNLVDPFCLVGTSSCAYKLKATVVDKTPVGPLDQQVSIELAKSLGLPHSTENPILYIISLPKNPDKSMGNRLKKLIRVDKKKGEVSPLAICSATSQVRIVQHLDGSWTLMSVDKKGRNKKIGGDEYYVTYQDASSSSLTLVAFDHDNGDGTYNLDFWTTPLNPVTITGRGKLTVYLQYSCGIGAMGRPLKDEWRGGGATAGARWSRANVITPSYRIFSPPNDPSIDLSPYSMVIGYGDSLMKGFFLDKNPYKYPRSEPLYRPNTTDYVDNPMLELIPETVDGLMETLIEWHGHQLNQSSVALVIGSAVWDLLTKETVDPHFTNHLEGVRQYIKRLQQEYPNVPLYWRSCSAFQTQQLTFDSDRTQYMSNSRARILNEKQKILMTELGIPFLDLYDAYFLSGDHELKRNDGRHYNKNLNMLMQNWFYRGD